MAVVAVALLAVDSVAARAMLGLILTGTGLGVVALRAPEGRRLPRLVSLCGFVLTTHLAGFLAWSKALRGELNPIWEPTRRPV